MSISRLLSNLREDRKLEQMKKKTNKDRRKGKIISQEGGWGFNRVKSEECQRLQPSSNLSRAGT